MYKTIIVSNQQVRKKYLLIYFYNKMIHRIISIITNHNLSISNTEVLSHIKNISYWNINIRFIQKTKSWILLQWNWIKPMYKVAKKEETLNIDFLIKNIFFFLQSFLAHEITNKFSLLLCVYHSYGISKFFLTFFLRWCAMCVCVCVLAYSRFPMHHRSSIPVELRKWECVPMCASTDRQRAKEEKIVAVFLFLFFYSRVFLGV